MQSHVMEKHTIHSPHRLSQGDNLTYLFTGVYSQAGQTSYPVAGLSGGNRSVLLSPKHEA